MTITIFLLTLGAIARLTRLITSDYIARHIRVWAIRRFGPDHDLAYLVTCPWCLSVWIAAALTPAAWFWGEHPGFVIPAAALTISYLIGIAASVLDATEEAS